MSIENKEDILINSIRKAKSIKEITRFARVIYKHNTKDFIKLKKEIEDLAKKELENTPKEDALSLIVHMTDNSHALDFNFVLLSAIADSGFLNEALKHAPYDDFIEYTNIQINEFELGERFNNPHPDIIKQKINELRPKDYCVFFHKNKWNQYCERNKVLSYDLFIENMNKVDPNDFFEDKFYEEIQKNNIHHLIIREKPDGYLIPSIENTHNRTVSNFFGRIKPKDGTYKEMRVDILDLLIRKMESYNYYIKLDLISPFIERLKTSPDLKIKQSFANIIVKNFRLANDDNFFSDVLYNQKILSSFLKT